MTDPAAPALGELPAGFAARRPRPDDVDDIVALMRGRRARHGGETNVTQRRAAGRLGPAALLLRAQRLARERPRRTPGRLRLAARFGRPHLRRRRAHRRPRTPVARTRGAVARLDRARRAPAGRRSRRRPARLARGLVHCAASLAARSTQGPASPTCARSGACARASTTCPPTRSPTRRRRASTSARSCAAATNAPPGRPSKRRSPSTSASAPSPSTSG